MRNIHLRANPENREFDAPPRDWAAERHTAARKRQLEVSEDAEVWSWRWGDTSRRRLHAFEVNKASLLARYEVMNYAIMLTVPSGLLSLIYLFCDWSLFWLCSQGTL